MCADMPEQGEARDVTSQAQVVAPLVSDNRQDLNIAAFCQTYDPEENAVQWSRWLKGFCRKVHFFRVTSMQDKIDALYIYGGHDVENLLDTLPDPPRECVTLPPYIREEGEELNEFHIQVFKLHTYFCTTANKDSARAKFETLTQGDKFMAEYHVDLRKQAKKCQFPDMDDAIRSKILQTMTDKNEWSYEWMND